MECLANTSSFDHACFKIDGFSFKKHSTKVGPRHSTPPQFLFECAPLIKVVIRFWPLGVDRIDQIQ